MSYRRTYSGTVNYSGSVSYPASQSGGTVDYSGSIPVDITIDVDTDSFDASVGRCNDAVNGLTTAVVATEAAQVEAKRKASIQIAGSIIKGFFNYVSVELSQKMKELASQCESLLGLIVEYGEHCLSRRSRMENGYNRIVKRYSDVFEDLDREAASRVEALEGGMLKFVGSAERTLGRPTDSELLGHAAVSADEHIRLDAAVSCSHLKRESGLLIERAKNYLTGAYEFSNSVSNMLVEPSADEKILLPVMFVESVASAGSLERRVVSTGQGFEPCGIREKMKLVSKFKSRDLEWERMPDADYEKMISYLKSDLQEGNLDGRVADIMADLMAGGDIEIIKC